jgi:hypothetical protein
LEYDPREEILCLRMPTTIHESFSGRVSDAIKRQLQKIAEGGGIAADFAARISSVRSGRILLQEFDPDDPILKSDRPYIQREPDEQFQHADAEYPGVVCEIAYSQDGKDLDKAAWVYIPHSNGDVKAVVGFELAYRGSKEARISMWRPHYVKGDRDELENLDVETVINHVVSINPWNKATLISTAFPSTRWICCQHYGDTASSSRLLCYI